VEAESTSLEIDQVFVEDAGDYCVIATNSAGDARTCCHLSVTRSSPWQPAAAAGGESLSGPGFTSVFDDVTVQLGESCTMRVTVTGNPLPQVYIF